MESGKVEEEGKFSDQVCGGSEVHRGGKKEWNGMWKERSPHPRRDRQTDRQGTCNSASRGGLDREREREEGFMGKLCGAARVTPRPPKVSYTMVVSSRKSEGMEMEVTLG